MVFMSSIKERVVFFVGAGLLNDAHLPTSVELVTKLKAALASRAEDITLDEDTRKLATLQTAVFNFLNGGIRFQRGVLNHDPDTEINIEQVAVAALRLRERMNNPLAPYVSGWHQRIRELEEQRPDLLPKLVDFIYDSLGPWLTFKKKSDIAYLDRLIDFCSEGIGVDIFSLNYDLCLETAIVELANRKLVNGFTEDGWRASTLEDDTADVRLFKLHGSLDWIDDEKAYGLCSLQWPRHKDAEDVEGEHRPLLIFGTDQKLTAKEPFLTLVYHFSQEVQRRAVLVIIGYSFGDEYVNQIIEQGLRVNPKLRIVLVSPNANNRAQAFPIFSGSPRIIPISKGAQEALNGGEIKSAVRDLLKEAKDERL
jgi:hypothetical protein